MYLVKMKMYLVNKYLPCFAGKSLRWVTSVYNSLPCTGPLLKFFWAAKREAEEPGRRPSMGLHRVGHDWSNLAAAARGRQKAFLSLLDLDCLQLKIMYVPKWHILQEVGMAYSAPLHYVKSLRNTKYQFFISNQLIPSSLYTVNVNHSVMSNSLQSCGL